MNQPYAVQRGVCINLVFDFVHLVLFGHSGVLTDPMEDDPSQGQPILRHNKGFCSGHSFYMKPPT